MDTAGATLREADRTLDESPTQTNWWITLLRHILAVFIYLLLMELGSFMPIRDLNDSVFLLWPATGFVLAIAVRGGYGYLITFGIAALLWTGFAQQYGWLYAFLRALSVVASVGLATFAMRNILDRRHALEAIKDVFVFLALGPLACGLVVAALTTTSLCLVDESIPWSEFSRLFTPWWLAEAVGILVLAPFAMVWTARTKINWSNRQIFEVAIWLVVLMFVCVVVFGNWAPTDTLRYPLELAMFPILCWAAIRFGQRGATVGVVIVSIMAIWEILQVLGPEQKYISTRPEFIWVFVGVLSATTFFLAAIMTEVLRREEKAAANERHLQAFIDALPDVAFIMNREGRYIEAYASQSGDVYRDVNDWIGQTVWERWPQELAESFMVAIDRALETREPQSLEYMHLLADQEYWFEGRVAPMLDELENRDQVIWVAYEVTERKKALAALEVRDRVLEGVSQATTALLASEEMDEGVAQALDSIGSYVQVESIRLVARASDVTEVAKKSPPPWKWTNAPFAKLSQEAEEPSLNWRELHDDWTERLEAGEIVHRSIDKCEETVKTLLERRSIQSILLAPIFVQGKFWGALELCDQRARLWEESEIASLRVAAGSIGSFIQSRKGEDKLRQAKVAADRANQAKGEFLAMMSHEIRTPMNAVLGYTDLLAQTPMNDQQKEWLGIVNRSGKSLLELINNILDYSKIESRGVELEYQVFNLENCVMEALELILVKAKQKGIEIKYNLSGEPAGSFIGDSHRLRQVLLNLVNNAVKFTSKGSVEVSLTISNTPEVGRCRINVAVKDTGVGIAPAQLHRLFQPFTQADSSTTRRFGGTGLGLVISKRLVERMGGDIAVQSEEGAGSVFSFHVFLNRAPTVQGNTAPSEDLTHQSLADSAPLRILLVEDDPVNQQLAKDVLSSIGYACDIAENEDGVIEHLKNNVPYDCILMDIQLPGKGGLEITDGIRMGEYGEDHCGTHIIAVTANALPGDRKKCLDAGTDDYLSKPLVLQDLKDSLYQAYRKTQQ
ncbi:MAG: ATP-binding protein [Verrucomicrobiota bacterium]